MVGAVELYFRLAVATFVIVAPTALFLAFWRGLMMLRDERLIDRILNDEQTYVTPPLYPGAYLPGMPDEPPSLSEEFVSCSQCGAPNPHGATFCHECLERIG